jgi:hypothetical protein
MEQPVRLVVKLREHVPTTTGPERICQLLGKERVCRAEPLFKDACEAELASVFEVRLVSSASVQEALAALAEDEDVEYAHTPQERTAF